MDFNGKLSNFNIKSIFDNSEEIYFGNNVPLPLILKNFATELKTFFGTDENPIIINKDNAKIKRLISICDNTSMKLEEELNAEKVYLVVNSDLSVNAGAYSMTFDKNIKVIEKNGIKTTTLDLEKIKNIEGIERTKTGFKYTNKKGKYIFIYINEGLIRNADANTIAATICHEIGHCFETGIFGYLKELSDGMVLDEVTTLKKYTYSSLFAIDYIFIGIIYNIIKFCCFVIASPFIGIGLFSGLYDQYQKIKGRLVDEKHFTMKDVDKASETDPDGTFDKLGNNIELLDVDRKSIFEELKLRAINAYKNGTSELELENKKTNIFVKIIIVFIKSILSFCYYLNSIPDTLINLLSLSDYTFNTIFSDKNKLMLRKYEYFADIFASAYGFSEYLQTSYQNWDIEAYSDKKKLFYTHVEYIPIIGTILSFNRLIKTKNKIRNNAHGDQVLRSNAIYTNLVYTLKNDKTLSVSQKKEIEDHIKQMEENDEKYRKLLNESGGYHIILFSCLLHKRINKDLNPNVIDNILVPIEETCKEVVKRTKK